MCTLLNEAGAIGCAACGTSAREAATKPPPPAATYDAYAQPPPAASYDHASYSYAGEQYAPQAAQQPPRYAPPSSQPPPYAPPQPPMPSYLPPSSAAPYAPMGSMPQGAAPAMWWPPNVAPPPLAQPQGLGTYSSAGFGNAADEEIFRLLLPQELR